MRTSRAARSRPSVPARHAATRAATRAARLVALGLAGVLLAGCSASTSDSGAAIEGEMPMPASEDKGYDSAQSAADGGAEEAGAPGAVAGDEERMVIVSGSVTVVVKDPIDAVDKVAALVDQAGGFVAGREQQSAQDDQRAWARLTARIPAEKLSGVIADLEDLGDVDSTQLSSTEVTAQAKDLDARIRALELSIDRLTDLLARSGDLADIVAAEQVLTDRQSQLEQLQSQRASLADQVAMSTVDIGLYTDEQVPAPSSSGFLGGLENGWDSLVTFLGALVTVIGALIPWLAAAAVVGLALWPVVRRSRRRRAERTAAAQAARAAQPATAYERLQVPVPVGAGAPIPAGYPAPPAAPAPSPVTAPVAAPPAPPAATTAEESPAGESPAGELPSEDSPSAEDAPPKG